MTLVRRHWALGAMTGWWALAARTLALVMALAVAAPSAGLAENFSYHQGGHGHDRDRTWVAVGSEAASEGSQAADPGLNGHVHCGCHVAVSIGEAGAATPIQVSRPSYASLNETVSSVVPDRLPRPPRA